MKSKRFLGCILAVLLVLPVVRLPAAAAFPDVTGNWSWASDYIEDMTQKGIFNGYEDGTFRPARELTTGEALALCARSMGLSNTMMASIASDRADEITAIFGTAQSWFHQDYAVCLELGVVTASELKSMWQSGTLTASITKENFAVYLVRAMGLDKMAENLPTYSMNFADVSSISTAYRPYVYLLNAYGIVEGTTDNKFEPKSSLNRAVSATMLSRIVDFMEDKGLSVELPDYTDYEWAAGTIVSVAAGDGDSVLLTLNEAGTARVFTLPATVPIYENNMSGSATSLKAGMYARVCLNDDDPIAVRLVSADRLETVSAAVSDISDDSISLVVSGVTKTYGIDRFTQVVVGGVTGDRTLIDRAAGYTGATCTADGSDVLMLQLSGGTSRQVGLISSVATGTAGTSLQVTSFNGITRTFTVPSNAAITINGLTGTLKTSHVGYYISMQVSNDNSGQVASAAVDTETAYIQASVLGVTYTSSPNTIYVKNLATGASVVYTMADNPTITYEGTATTLAKVAKGWYLTAKMDSNGHITVLEAYEGSVTVEGTLTSIGYGTTTVITVSGEDKEEYAFSLDMTALPTIRRSDAVSSIDKLRVGDTVSVTSQYNEVTLIESEPQEASVSGTITSITHKTSGSTMELQLEDGGTATYELTGATAITQDGSTRSLNDLQPGYQVGVVTSGDQIISVEVESTKTEASATEITGTAIYINTTSKTILLRTTDSSGTAYVITVNVPYGTTVISVTGTSLSLSSLSIGDEFIIYGAYDGGEFDANVVMRK